MFYDSGRWGMESQSELCSHAVRGHLLIGWAGGFIGSIEQRREGEMSFEEQYPADECAGCHEYEKERVRLTARLAAAEAARPMQKLTEEIQSDDDYAWSWHCNIAMPIYDEGQTHEAANKAAARVMSCLFSVDVTEFEPWKAFPWAKKEAGK